jgi:hypothetical protein
MQNKLIVTKVQVEIQSVGESNSPLSHIDTFLSTNLNHLRHECNNSRIKSKSLLWVKEVHKM